MYYLKVKKIALIAVILALIAGGFYYFSRRTSKFSFGEGQAGSAATAVSGRETFYENADFMFSVTLPAGYSAREITNDDSRTVLFENSKGDGVQIVVTPFDDIRVVTEEMIKKDIPDIKMSDVQPVEIGTSNKGIAFISDNAEFGGSAREIWFVFKANLYQISTYSRLDPVLKSIFATWQFK